MIDQRSERRRIGRLPIERLPHNNATLRDRIRTGFERAQDSVRSINVSDKIVRQSEIQLD
jgi:hypothetical protein